jgi:hypothetical protein
MQDGHVITFESKKLVRAHLRLAIHEKNLFAMVSDFKTWQYYLGSQKIEVFIDNVSLIYFEM